MFDEENVLYNEWDKEADWLDLDDSQYEDDDFDPYEGLFDEFDDEEDID
jgi:hypothetical protein